MNLVTDQWIETNDGFKSLLDIFNNLDSLTLYGNDEQRYAYFILLHTITNRVFPIEEEYDLKEITIEKIREDCIKYLDDRKDDFDLNSFMQVPEIYKEKVLDNPVYVVALNFYNEHKDSYEFLIERIKELEVSIDNLNNQNSKYVTSLAILKEKTVSLKSSITSLDAKNKTCRNIKAIAKEESEIAKYSALIKESTSSLKKLKEEMKELKQQEKEIKAEEKPLKDEIKRLKDEVKLPIADLKVIKKEFEKAQNVLGFSESGIKDLKLTNGTIVSLATTHKDYASGGNAVINKYQLFSSDVSDEIVKANTFINLLLMGTGLKKGDVKYADSIHVKNAIKVIPQGKSLYDTLLLNIYTNNELESNRFNSRGVPFWEHRSFDAIDENGYLDNMFAMSKAIYMIDKDNVFITSTFEYKRDKFLLWNFTSTDKKGVVKAANTNTLHTFYSTIPLFLENVQINSTKFGMVEDICLWHFGYRLKFNTGLSYKESITTDLFNPNLLNRSLKDLKEVRDLSSVLEKFCFIDKVAGQVNSIYGSTKVALDYKQEFWNEINDNVYKLLESLINQDIGTNKELLLKIIQKVFSIKKTDNFELEEHIIRVQAKVEAFIRKNSNNL